MMLESNILKLQKYALRLEELEQTLSQPEIINDIARYTELSKELGDLQPLVEQYRQDTSLQTEIVIRKS